VTVIFVVAAFCPAFSQSSGPKYQVGTILAVKQDPNPVPHKPDATRYDVSVRVEKTVYVVLYTPPPGGYGFQYAAGHQLLVLVGSKTITFNDVLGESREVPILSRSVESGQSP
jgi:hypothetical protein